MKESIPDVKLLLVVKNPINRIVSEIVHQYVDRGGLLRDEKLPEHLDDLILNYKNKFQDLDQKKQGR